MKNYIQLKAKLLFALGAVFIGCSAIYAQEVMKHPRVVEIEDRLNKDAANYIKSRFPGIPFMVTVRVDPLRRDTYRGLAGQSESLPYFESEEDEEIKDEWDNTQIPLMALLNRVRKVQVNIAVPSKLKETEVTELKEGIYEVLHLTPARDNIEITRRDWALNEIPWAAIYLTAGVLFSLLLGLLVINRSSANRIARALTEMKFNNSSNSSNSMPAPTPHIDNEPAVGRKSQSQEVKFNDPIKMKELATRHIEFLMKSKMFPNHQDIFLLDKFGKEHPEKLGAILGEFPAEMQRKLFSYASEFHWIEALNEPGFLDFECLEVLQGITQHPRESDDLDWDHAILAVWRLGESRTQFLKSLAKEEAFGLLLEMPKSVAVFEARKSFPGSWAAILDPTFKPAKMSAKRIKEIQDSATRILPLNDIEMVNKYRSEKELLNYLKGVDAAEERDIYGAAPANSLIHKLRPPFYPVFDQSADILQWFVPGVSTEQWALALFNIPKPERVKIDSQFSEKQKYLLIDRFKRFDANPPDRATVGSAREKVGILLAKYLTEKATADKVNTDTQTLNGTDDSTNTSEAA